MYDVVETRSIKDLYEEVNANGLSDATRPELIACMLGTYWAQGGISGPIIAVGPEYDDIRPLSELLSLDGLIKIAIEKQIRFPTLLPAATYEEVLDQALWSMFVNFANDQLWFPKA